MALPREGSGAIRMQDAQQRQSTLTLTRKSERPPAILEPSEVTASRIRQASPASTSSSCEQLRREDQHHQKKKKKKQESEDSTRPTDLAELDMQALVEANLLNYDTQEGEFSGWIYVAEMILRRTRRRSSVNSSRRKSSTHAQDTRAADMDAAAAAEAAHKSNHRRKDHRLVFRRRFCRLRELMCAFYESDASACQPIDHHVIISVERVHERNKAFQFTDYEDRSMMCYTSLGADFEEWFSAFASAVRTTQVSKSRLIESGNGLQKKKKQKHRSTIGITTSTGSTAPSAAPERTRSHTDGYLLNNRKPTVHDPLFDGDELDERTHTAWLYLEYPWWKLHRRRSRRYFVLSGTTLSCFSVNKEGQLADFTKSIASFKYQPEKTPFAVDVTFESGKRLRLSRSGANDRAMKDWVAHLQAALHYYESRVTAQEFEKSEADDEKEEGHEVKSQHQAQRGILV